MEWKEKSGLRWLEVQLPGATAAFTTRIGGSSERPFDSLNLGVLTGDRRESVLANRRRLAGALGLAPERIAMGRQVHGAELLGHGGPQLPAPYAEPGPDPPEVDGHHTAEPELAMLVLVADCLPIALGGAGGVAMLHGGWRGLAAGIVSRGVAAIGGATHAAIGPGIGPCCYEVGPEVLAALDPLAAAHTDGRMLDLAGVAAAQLAEAGVGEIDAAGLCTNCNPELLFSHRGQGPETGRQAGLVWRST